MDFVMYITGLSSKYMGVIFKLVYLLLYLVVYTSI